MRQCLRPRPFGPRRATVESISPTRFGLPYRDRLVSADYLLWWTTGARLPPLVTTSPPGTAPADAGVLGTQGATVLFGDQVGGGDARSGFRTILGIWLDATMLWDLEFDYFSPGGRSASFTETSDGNPILARPFLDFQLNRQSALAVAYPGVATGTVAAEASDYFQSFGLSVSRCLYEYNFTDPFKPAIPLLCPSFISAYRFDFLGAFRYYGLSDRVSVGENVVFANYFGVQNVNVASVDNFAVGNDFFGGEIGLRTRMRRGNWSLDVLGKVALGNNHRVVNIAGETAIMPPGGPTIPVASGALAAGSNIGVHTQDAFTAIPALNVELGYRWNGHWRTYVGYDLIYWAEVARAADQIDLALDRSGAGQRRYSRTAPRNSWPKALIWVRSFGSKWTCGIPGKRGMKKGRSPLIHLRASPARTIEMRCVPILFGSIIAQGIGAAK